MILTATSPYTLLPIHCPLLDPHESGKLYSLSAGALLTITNCSFQVILLKMKIAFPLSLKFEELI